MFAAGTVDKKISCAPINSVADIFLSTVQTANIDDTSDAATNTFADEM